MEQRMAPAIGRISSQAVVANGYERQRGETGDLVRSENYLADDICGWKSSWPTRPGSGGIDQDLVGNGMPNAGGQGP